MILSSNNSIAGNYGRRPLTDIHFYSKPKLAGPFYGDNAVQQLQEVCKIETNPEVPIVFTHNDFCPPNILLTPGPNPKVAAVIDWAQSGWYPAYWDYCKARYVGRPWGLQVLISDNVEIQGYKNFTRGVIQDEWWTKYLPKFLDPVDEEGVRHPWMYFAYCNF